VCSSDLQAEDWSGARNTLSAKLKSGSLPRDVFRRRDAVLALSEAREIVEEGTPIEARERAIEANRQSPDLVPAAAMAARATAGFMVSMEMNTSGVKARTACTSGSTRSLSCCSDTAPAPGRVLSPPISMMSAPAAINARA